MDRKLHNFRELKTWQLGMAIAGEVFALCKNLKTSDLYGILNQIRRSAVSIPSNIAEGCGGKTNRQLLQFLGIAQGSAYELETQLLLMIDINLASAESIREVIDMLHEFQRMNAGLISKLEADT